MDNEHLKAAGWVVGDTLVMDTHKFEVAYLHGLLERADELLVALRNDEPYGEVWQSDELKALREEIATVLGKPL